MRQQRLGTIGRPAEDDGGRISQAALELARCPGRLSPRTSLGGVAGQDLAVRTEDDDRWDRRGLPSELEDLGTLAAHGRRGGVGRPQVDPE